MFDLDGVNLDDDGDGPCGLVDLVYQAVGGGGADLFPMPTYIASSGTGLHLYYVLSEPLRLWPNVCEALVARFFGPRGVKKNCIDNIGGVKGSGVLPSPSLLLGACCVWS